MRPLRIIGTILVLLSFLIISSCDENIFSDYSDDTSDEAQMEQALMYLDDGNYAAAKAILLTLNQNDEEVKRALASSYAGTAGLDIPSLITAIDDSSNSGVETIGLILGDTSNNNQLSSSLVTSKLSDINSAISLYGDLTQTDSVKAQLCILHATRTVLLIADDLANEGVTVGAYTVNVPLDATLKGTVAAGDIDTHSGAISFSMEYIRSNIGSISLGDSDGNSLSDGFNDFYTQVDFDGDNSIDADDIADFINTHIN